MSDCGNSSLNKTFIIEPLSITGGSPTLSACTTMFTNFIQSCSGNTSITLGTNIISFSGALSGATISATTISSNTINSNFYYSGGTLLRTAVINIISGQTVGIFLSLSGGVLTGPLTATTITANTISATTFYGNGNNLTNIPDSYITATTTNNTNRTYTLINNTGGTVIITGLTDVFITGGTLNTTTRILSLVNSTGNTITITGFSDTFTTAATYSNGIVYFNRNDQLSAYTLNLSSMSGDANTFVTGVTLNINTLTLTRNDAVNISVDLSGIKFTGGSTNCIANLYVTNIVGCSPITFWDSLKHNGSIVSGTSSIAFGLTNTNLSNYSAILGGSGNTLTSGATNSIILGGRNITGTTSDTIYIPNIVTTAITTNIISATTISGITFFGNGSNLTGILTQDIFVTGGTYNNSIGTATFRNNTGGTFTVTGFTTGSTGNNFDVFVTGSTFSNNILTFTNNTGGTFTVLINNLSGLTVNGNINSNTLSATNITAITEFIKTAYTNVLSATTITGYTLSILNTTPTKSFDVTDNGRIFLNGDSGSNSDFCIHQLNIGNSRILDIYNSGYTKAYLVINDNGSSGNVILGNNTLEINAFTQNVGIGIIPNTSKLRLKGDSVNQDIITINPFLGSGGAFFNSNANNDPFFYLQNSAGTATQISIQSSGNSYFNGGNVGFGSTTSAQDAIHIFNGTIRINDTTYGFGKLSVSDANGRISFSSITELNILTASTNTFITGTSFTNNILALTNNSGLTLNTLINDLSGLTINGNAVITNTETVNRIIATGITSNTLSATSITGTTILGININSNILSATTISADTIYFKNLSATTLTASTLQSNIISGTNITAVTVTSPTIYGSAASGGTLTIDASSNPNKGILTFGAVSGSNIYNFNIGSTTSVFTIRERIGAVTQGALYLGVAVGTESSSNYTFNYNGTLNINTQSSTSPLALMIGGNAALTINPANSTALAYYSLSTRSRTTLTSGATIPVFDVTTNTQQFATGNVPNQYFYLFRNQIIGFVGNSTVSLIANMAVAPPIAGSNAIFNTATAFYVSGGSYINTTTGYGALITAPSGATTNYAIGAIGDVIVTGSTITNTLSATSFTAVTLFTQTAYTNTLRFSGTPLITTVSGVTETDGKNLLFSNNSGTRYSLGGTLFMQTSAQTVSNTVAETSIIGSGVTYIGSGITTPTLPPNFFTVGRAIRIKVGGIYSTPISVPSVLVRVKIGTTTVASATTTSLLSNASNLKFEGEVIIVCQKVGTSGTTVCHGDIEYAIGAAGQVAIDALNANGSPTVIDTTISNLLDITIVWDTASSTRTATSIVSTFEVLN